MISDKADYKLDRAMVFTSLPSTKLGDLKERIQELKKTVDDIS